MKGLMRSKAARSLIAMLMLMALLVSNTMSVLAAADAPEDAPGSHRLELVGVEGEGKPAEVAKSPVSSSMVLSIFAKTRGYTTFSNYFHQSGHTESTVAADSADMGGSVFGLQMDAAQNYEATIVGGKPQRRNFTQGNVIYVEHVYNDDINPGVRAAYITLGIRSTDGVVDMSRSVKVEEDGTAKTAFYAPNGSYTSYVIYPGNGTYSADGKLSSGEAVKFENNGQAITVMNKFGDNVSYFNHVSFKGDCGYNNPGAFIAGTSEAYEALKAMVQANHADARLKIQRITLASGSDVINFKSELAGFADYSAKLGNGSSSGDVNVFEVNKDIAPTNPGEALKDGTQIGFDGKKYIVINYEIPEGEKNANLNGFGLIPGSVGGFSAADDYIDPSATDQVSRIIINVITRDESGNAHPYDGVLNITNMTAGFILAPNAELRQAARICGAIVADKIYHTQEIHSIGYASDLSNGSGTFHIEVGGGSPEEEEEEEKPTVTYALTIEKTDGDGKSLDGAEFELYKGNASGSPLTFTSESAGSYAYAVDGKVTKLTTKDGIISITGLTEKGIYSIKETKVPEGDGTFIYTCDDQVTTVSVDENTGKGVDKTIVNNREAVYGSLSVHKVVLGQGPASDSAFFFTVKNTDTGSYVTNPEPVSSDDRVFIVGKDAEREISDLVPGTYQVTEVDKDGKALGDDFDYLTSYSPEKGITNVRKDEKALVTIKNEKIDYKGTLKLKKVGDDGAPVEGARFLLFRDGKADGYYVTGADGIISLVDCPLGEYYMQEDWESDEYEIPVGDAAKTETVKISKTNLDASFKTVVNKKIIKGSVRVNKLDENGKPLTGAQFKLTRQDGSPVKLVGSAGSYDYSEKGHNDLPLETNDKGTFIINNLPAGEYTICETKAPKGYTVKVEATDFVIDASNTAVTKDIVNSKINASVRLHKVDDTKEMNPVARAKFDIVKVAEDGTKSVVSSITTGEDGTAEFKGLAAGDYFVVETSAPEGYVMDDTPYPFEINEKNNGEVVVINGDGKNHVVNKCGTGKLVIKKVDFESGFGMSGVKFDIYLKEPFLKFFERNKYIATITTGEGGMAEYAGLVWGDYVLKEQKVEGYEKHDDLTFTIGASNTVYKFTDDADAQQGVIINKREKAEVTLQKVDEKTNKPLANAVFNLYKAKEGNVSVADIEAGPVRVCSTDSKGIITETNLDPGTYYFMEVSAPKGYEADTTTRHKVIAGTDSAAAKVVVTNKRKLGTVKIKKVDTEGNPLKGAEFTLLTEKEPENPTLGQIIASFMFKENSIWYKYKTAVSGEDGVAEFTDVEYGTYVFNETGVPEGYLKTTESAQEITVDVNKLELDYTVRNQKKAEEEKPADTSSSKAVKETSSSSSAAEEEKPADTSSSEAVKETSSSSSAAEEEKPADTSSSETVKETSSSSSAAEEEKPKATSSSKAEEKKTETSSSKAEEKKTETSSSSKPEEEKSTATSSSKTEKKASSSAVEKKSTTSSSKAEEKKTQTSSSKAEEKKSETTSSSAKQEEDKVTSSSSSKQEEETSDSKSDSSSSAVKDDETSSSVKEESKTSSSSVKKDTATSSSEAGDKIKSSSSSKQEEETSGKSDNSSSRRRHDSDDHKDKHKDKHKDDDDDNDSDSSGDSGSSDSGDSADNGGHAEEDETSDESKKGSVVVIEQSGEAKKSLADGIAGVLGVCAPPMSDVLGEIAAPLTGDDMNPGFWLVLAGIAAAILGAIIAITKRRRS